MSGDECMVEQMVDSVEEPEADESPEILGTNEQQYAAKAQEVAEQRIAATEAYIRTFLEVTGEDIEDLELAERLEKTEAGAIETSWFLRRKEAKRGDTESKPSSIIVAG